MKSPKCTELHKDWEEKCNVVWNSTITNVCSDECRNATHYLVNHEYGVKLRGCDCGLFDGSKKPEETAAIGECHVRRSKMREVCGYDDAGKCQQCAAKKGMCLVNI